jgi:hypothetical protein
MLFAFIVFKSIFQFHYLEEDGKLSWVHRSKSVVRGSFEE